MWTNSCGGVLHAVVSSHHLWKVSVPIGHVPGTIYPHIDTNVRGLRRNGDNGTSAQEILPEYCLSQVHGGLELGIKGSKVRCWGTEQVKGS